MDSLKIYPRLLNNIIFLKDAGKLVLDYINKNDPIREEKVSVFKIYRFIFVLFFIRIIIKSPKIAPCL